MNNLFKIMPKWIVVAPVAIILSTFLFIYFFMFWTNQAQMEAQIQTAQQSYINRAHRVSHEKINEIIFALDTAKEFAPKLKSDEWLIENLKYALHVTNDYAYVFRLNTKEHKLLTLFSNTSKIPVGKVVENPSKIMIDKEDLIKLSKKQEVYKSDQISKKEFISILLMPYRDTDLVVGVGVVLESFEISYLKHFQEYSKAISQKRNLVFSIFFVVIAVISLLISWFVKRLNDNFEHSKQELKEKNKALSEQLYKDPSTGLFNETMLHKKISGFDMPKLILIEVDGFKAISEYSGHEVADEIVKFMKGKLLKFCEKYNEFDMELFRVTNNQFALLENAPLNMERYEEIASKLVQFLKGVTIISPVDGEALDFNCTVGLSMEDENIFQTASIALRRAKANERDFLCYFKNIGAGEEYKKQAKSADYIKKALQRDSVVPFFQPIFDKDGNITKHECLVRIVGENQEIIAPRIFLETSRRIKRYSDIEKSLIQKSLETIIGSNKTISINLSSRDMTDSNVSNFVVEKINQYNLANQVIFEILEDENIRSIDRVAGFIKKVKTMGVRIAIDDFGSGYSNFSYLLELKPDYIKIDGSLIKNIHTDKRSCTIVKAILLFAKQLDIKTIAEFVHSKEVFEVCIELGIDEFQGFYLGEPGPNLH